MKKILIIEDDLDIQELIQFFLEDQGYEVITASDGIDGIAVFLKEQIDLILLDILLPKMDGYAVCELIRKESEVPIIMISALGREEDQIKGFEMQIDDYIPKPFGMMALVARIKAVLRRTEKPVEEKVLRLGELSVNPTRHVVQVSGETVNLTLKEFELLCLLLDNPGVVFTRDQLLNQIWGYSFDGESRTVDVHVRHLRQKLGDCGNYIETVRGIGYRSGDGKA